MIKKYRLKTFMVSIYRMELWNKYQKIFLTTLLDIIFEREFLKHKHIRDKLFQIIKPYLFIYFNIIMNFTFKKQKPTYILKNYIKPK